MTKEELREMIALKTVEFIESGGAVKKTKRPRWAQGAKNKSTMKVASKGATYSRAYTGPVGMCMMDLEAMGNRACGYNGTKYVMS